MLTSAQLNAGCIPFIQAGNPDELTERIREQDRLRAGEGTQPRDCLRARLEDAIAEQEDRVRLARG